MTRPRFHDVIIVVSLVALLGLGVWALWWDDVRGFLNLGPANSEENVPVQPGQT